MSNSETRAIEEWNKFYSDATNEPPSPPIDRNSNEDPELNTCDLLGEEDWSSMAIGFFLASGISAKRAHEMVRSDRRNLGISV